MVDSSGSRPGGRANKEFRSLLCERSVLSRADGSAQWTQGGTSIIAAVYGPRQAPSRKEDATQAVMEVTFKPVSGLQGSKDITYESHIQKLLEGVIVTSLHPRTCISVVLQVVREDGALFACALNAVFSALLDAGVPLKHMVAAASCAVMPEGELRCDPDAAEEEAARATVCAAFGYHRDAKTGLQDHKANVIVSSDVLTCLTTGVLETRVLFDALDFCQHCCKDTLAVFALHSLHRSLEFKIG